MFLAFLLSLSVIIIVVGSEEYHKVEIKIPICGNKKKKKKKSLATEVLPDLNEGDEESYYLSLHFLLLVVRIVFWLRKE